MHNFLIFILLLSSLLTSADEFSVMTLNAQNLFDIKDDPKKDDKAYLPIELKQSERHINSCQNIRVKSWKNECLYLDWDEDTKNAKLKNLANEIIKYDEVGPDILALQEVENLNILTQLFKLIQPYGYKDLTLIEGKDYRGIDTALITKFKILDPKLHYISFTGNNENKDTRPILEATININGKKIRIYNVHFPAGYHDVSMRIDSLNVLRNLLKSHQFPTIALGDFNINIKEDNKSDIYQSQEDYWSVAHIIGCKECNGSYYYGYENNWSFLDTIFLSKDRGINYVPKSIDIHATPINSYTDTGKPIRFNPTTKTGVSDHLPVVAKVQLN